MKPDHPRDTLAHAAQCEAALEAFLTTLESRPELRGARWVWQALLAAQLRRMTQKDPS